MGGEPLEKTRRVESGAADHRAAGAERGQQRRLQSVNVEQRHHVETAIVRGQAECVADALRRRDQVPVGERHQFGAGGRARCVK